MLCVGLHGLLIVAVLGSPLLCCCTEMKAPSQPVRLTEPPQPTCCHQRQPEPAPVESPKPSRSRDCGCKQKEPRAVVSSDSILKDFQPFRGLLAAETTIVDLPLDLAATREDHALPGGWYLTSQDRLRALPVLRL